MKRSADTSSFFNRRHAIQGFQILALVFWFFALTFFVLDAQRLGYVRLVTITWGAAAVALSGAAALLSKHVRSGAGPAFLGCAIGALYLITAWMASLWSR